MKFMSTRKTSSPIYFREALLQGLAPDGGLYIPETLPRLPNSLIKNSSTSSLPSLGQTIMVPFIADIPADALQTILNDALTFPIPLISLAENLYLLEVFHGPTLAFKDIGARFMASTTAYFLANESKKLAVLVATSGDTGSAIAHAFHNRPNIDVYILYPSQKISFLQEQQITTLGGNVHALEVTGTFDDCQQLVKSALLDADIRENRLLTTANSINIARLLPQMIYHSWGICQLRHQGVTKDPVLVVPSGNFGNLVSAIYAKAIGFPIHSFVAATNINAIVPHYLKTNQFIPKSSQASFSNAMDVGNPSNFERLLAFYTGDLQKMRREIQGISISDDLTLLEIRQTYDQIGYILDPHTAVGVAAARQTQLKHHTHPHPIIVTATAHPAKFPEVIKRAINREADMPERLKIALYRTKQSQKINAEYKNLKAILV